MPAKRKALSKRIRFDVFKRDSFVCQYCGSHPPEAILHVDHIIPVADGGQNDLDNLVTSCDVCNFGKGAVPLDNIPASLADRAKQVAEHEEQIRGYAEVMASKRHRVNDESLDVAAIFCDHFNAGSIRKDWFLSVKQFVQKIGVHNCMSAMELAVGRKPNNQRACFLYFCGVCWNLVRSGEVL